MYEALTGSPPYSDAASLQDLIKRIWAGPPAPLSTVAPHVPAKIAAIVSRAMTHDASGRYQTAEEMLVAVKRLLAGPPTITRAMLGRAAVSQAFGSTVPIVAGPVSGALVPSAAPVSAPVIVGSPTLAVSAPPASGAGAPVGASASLVPRVSGGTLPMSLPAASVSPGAPVPVVDPRRGRRSFALAAVTLLVTVGLSAVALRFVPKPAEHAPDAGSAGASEAGSAGTAGTSTTSRAGADPAVTGEPSDAGTPPDASAGAVQSAAPVGPGKAPSKGPATGASAKPKSAFSSGQRGI
jgi:hypothetical protein